MKLGDDTLLTGSVAGYHFSAVRPETLGATEYTLVTLAIDKTGSVSDFADDLFKIKRTVVEACRKSPRSENLLLRVIEFNSSVTEVHGFKPLSEIDPSGYQVPHCCGLTALYDATFAGISAANSYGKNLAAQDYLANAITFIITDGDDNASNTSVAKVKEELRKGILGESLESSLTVLVGVNSSLLGHKLKEFKDSAGIDQYEEIETATAQSLAKLADFVSRSISAQSQSLGTGGPSQALTF
ncbi:hypothetical protein LC612_36985 [Nostoc sp. CHAB 5834]|nr:hypothetical protein [Nostoc sp. CHAB 5834]